MHTRWSSLDLQWKMASKRFNFVRLTNSSKWTLTRNPLHSSELPTEFGQSVSDQLNSLVEDTRNASILSLVAMHKKKQQMNWVLQLLFV